MPSNEFSLYKLGSNNTKTSNNLSDHVIKNMFESIDTFIKPFPNVLD